MSTQKSNRGSTRSGGRRGALVRLQQARAARTARARLVRELADYRTAGERAELAAILSRATDSQRAELVACTGRTDWA